MPRHRKRRRLLPVAAILAALAALFCGYGCWEARQVRLVQTHLTFDNLPPAFDGLRILHVTDLHTRSFGTVERRLRRILSYTPADLLVLTGDLKAHLTTDDELVYASLERTFRGLSYPWGIVAVPGNHDTNDFYLGLGDRLPFHCLLRNSILLEWEGQRLALLGAATVRPNDGSRGSHEIDEATWVGNVARRRAPWGILPDGTTRPIVCDRLNDGQGFRILLAHTPDFITDAKADGVDLVLAGDTHGGQIRLPFHAALLGKSRLSRLHASGHFVEGSTQMYVSPGVGTLYVPIRFLCPPEVSLLILHRRPSPAPSP